MLTRLRASAHRKRHGGRDSRSGHSLYVRAVSRVLRQWALQRRERRDGLAKQGCKFDQRCGAGHPNPYSPSHRITAGIVVVRFISSMPDSLC